MTKTLYLLNIGNFHPEITRLTYPLIEYYAARIGASVHMITERKFKEWPVTYEKLQIHEIAKEFESDWHIYVDSDTLIHPECPDYTIYLPKGTVSFHKPDLSTTRFKPSAYAYRNGRYIAPGNWFTIASDLCLDLWRPLDITPEQAVSRIFPSVNEINHGITAEHLVDDFALAENIARFGLTFKSLVEINKEQRFEEHFFHQYTMTAEEKVNAMQKQLGVEGWNIPEEIRQWTK